MIKILYLYYIYTARDNYYIIIVIVISTLIARGGNVALLREGERALFFYPSYHLQNVIYIIHESINNYYYCRLPIAYLFILYPLESGDYIILYF